MLGYSRNLHPPHTSPFTLYASPNCSNILATFTCSSCHSSSQVESNTTPPPAQTCALVSLATTVRIKILKSTKPESSKKPITPQYGPRRSEERRVGKEYRTRRSPDT